ncbi:MAG: CDC48 family AAA ATPase [Candidatus Aenigmarchaeota archaeon]|nr:CDC48 family AAA ATPase [Candidatus Aenigmarchaeota archaeon]
MMEEISLKVGELTNREEFGRGIVRIDTRKMQDLGIKEGEIVELQGQRKTGAIAVRSYPADVGLNLIRMDGITRRNAGIGVGENIKVLKASVKEARRIVLAPAQKGIILQMSPDLLKKNLIMRPLMKKDIVAPFPVATRRRGGGPFDDFFGGMNIEEIFFSPIPGETKLVVVSTNPDGMVSVTEETEVELRPEAVETEEKVIPTITYEDIGGLGEAIQKIREMVELPMRHPELFTKLGIEPPKGVLLYGPPGSGKTLLARAVANESGVNFFSIAGPEIMSKWYGQSEENLRKIFEEAEKNAPSIIFIDEIDAIAPKREEVTGEVERRVVSQILTLMDGLKSRGKVIVIAATNRQNALDPALRRPGRFDREVEIGVPDQKGRKEILQIHTRNMPMDRSTVDLDYLASVTYGFVGADLEALAKEAAMSALRRNLPQISWKTMEELPPKAIEKLKVTKQDFDNALKLVEPSAMREVLVEIPKVKWDDVGGLNEVKESLREIVEWPLNHPESFERIGIRPPKGILLYGPPGSGKTLLARAVATESGANFISIKGPEIFSKWVGESEKHIRDIFRRARQVAPAIIFFDEIDALAPLRGLEVGTRVSENIVSQILTEMSGLEDMHNVVVIAATNRPDILDPAILRPGRFDRQVLVPAPDEEARLEILKIHTKKMPLKGVDLKPIAKETEGYSGADLEALVREAGLNALRKDFKAKSVGKKEFEEAVKRVKPSVTPDLVKFYNKISDRIKAPPSEKGKEKVDYVG